MIRSAVATSLGLLPIVLGLDLLILGQVVAPESMPALAANFGGYGLLGWYLYYNVRYTMPRLQEASNVTLDKAFAEFRAEMRESRANEAMNREAFRSGLQCNLSLAQENDLLKRKTNAG